VFNLVQMFVRYQTSVSPSIDVCQLSNVCFTWYICLSGIKRVFHLGKMFSGIEHVIHLVKMFIRHKTCVSPGRDVCQVSNMCFT
jgi:hypothetical protein